MITAAATRFRARDRGGLWFALAAFVGSAATVNKYGGPAAMIGPMVIGRRGPIRWARAPDRADSTSISPVTGSRAVPPASGLYPATT